MDSLNVACISTYSNLSVMYAQAGFGGAISCHRRFVFILSHPYVLHDTIIEGDVYALRGLSIHLSMWISLLVSIGLLHMDLFSRPERVDRCRHRHHRHRHRCRHLRCAKTLLRGAEEDEMRATIDGGS